MTIDSMVELKIPNEFVITYHARRRLKERFFCRQNKYQKVTVKAWYSTERINCKGVVRKFTGKEVHRSFQGHLFIFELKKNGKKVLITVLPQ